MTAAPSGDGEGDESRPTPTADDRLASTLDSLPTEASRPELSELDLWSSADAVELFVSDHEEVLAAIRAARAEIAAAADVVAERMSAGGRLIYVGAGTGGRLAALDAAEIAPSFGLHGRVVAVFAGGVDAMIDGREFYEDDEQQGAHEVFSLSPSDHDVVVGVSASGRTPYVLGGVRAAREAGAYTIGFACVAGSALARSADLTIEISTGPEVIAGSTRLKAGSAQKIVLNLLSTLAMVRLGRTYGSLMVDVSADNGKLRRRALRAVAEATGLAEDAAGRALDAAGGHAKVAIVAVLAGIGSDEARSLLARAHGQVRRALGLAERTD
jgi:N-acetylmuramic acid 6-phosphate etherase